jgi:hypothetical protein
MSQSWLSIILIEVILPAGGGGGILIYHMLENYPVL